jgi:murein DD-endopeptidase MepM/ murein hydrolase activator NlpD
VSAQAFLAWNQPVFSSFSGVVAPAEDGWPDRLWVNSLWEAIRAHAFQRRPKKDDLRPLLGSYVIVKGEIGYGLYAHLQQSSITLKVGDAVKVCHLLGKVGNSGNSAMPHLHFQVMD